MKGEEIIREWKFIEGSDNAYVSDNGKVKRNGKMLSLKDNSEGYLRCSVGNGKRDMVHRYVAKSPLLLLNILPSTFRCRNRISLP